LLQINPRFGENPMKKFVIAAVTAIGFAAPVFPALADTLSQSLMQAELDKCLANGTLTMEDVQGMTDDQLVSALDQCSKVSSSPSPSSYVAPIAPPVIAPAQTFVQPAPVGFNSSSAGNSAPVADGGGSSGGFDPSSVASNIGNAFQPGNFGQGNGDNSGGAQGGGAQGVGGLGNGGQGGNNGNGTPGNIGGGNNGGTGTANLPKQNSAAARIANLQKGIDQGIKNGSLTKQEAIVQEANLGALKASAANAGNSPNAQLKLQQQIDAADASFNKDVHNNIGIPDPNLSAHSLSRQRLASLNGNNGQTNAFSRFQQRLAMRQGGVASAGGTQTGAFARFQQRLASRQTFANKAGNSGGFAHFTQRIQQRGALANAGHGRTFVQRVRAVRQTGHANFARAFHRGGLRRLARR
jgi:hypothetical protein